jgi:hypothetical protein
MWGKRMAAIILAGMLFGSALAYADSQGLFKGFPKVKVLINSKELTNASVPGFVVDGKTVLPLRDVADATGAAVLWDPNTQTVNLVRPNAHLLIADSVTKDYSVKRVFGKIAKGKKEDFVVFAQVDSLSEPAGKVKITIQDPANNVVDSYEQKLTGEKEDFWLVRPFDVRFIQSGDYKVNLYLYMNATEEYALVASKTIKSE